MKKYQLNKKETKILSEQFPFIDKKSRIEIEETGTERLYFKDKKLILLKKNNRLVPTLKTNVKLKKVIVDMGAIRFVIKGADIMRPGIKDMQDFNRDELVVVVDEANKKPLAVCRAMYDSITMKRMTTGKVLENLHYVGDKYWQKS